MVLARNGQSFPGSIHLLQAVLGRLADVCLVGILAGVVQVLGKCAWLPSCGQGTARRHDAAKTSCEKAKLGEEKDCLNLRGG
jgi:hypothetical protein